MSAGGASLAGWQPRPRPARVVLEGRWVRLEPIAAAHAEGLWAASSAPGAEARFRFLFDHPPRSLADVEAWIARAAVLDDPLAFAVVDRASGRCGGRQALMRIVPEHGVIEIGSILWGPAIAGTRLATEAFALFARHVFDDLGYRRLEWKCNALHQHSRRAALRLGFAFEGVFRRHMVLKGESRDTAWFALTDDQWPAAREALARWLDPGNFDTDGKQRERLEALRNAPSSG